MGIQINNFTKTFGDTTVIDNLNLEIGSGEMIALLGPSGCGKSTTLFAISGIHKIDSGSIVFAGKDVTKLPPQERNVGVIFQSYALYPHMTVEENIAFPLMIRKESKAQIKRKVIDIAKLVKIDNLLHRKPAELSGGQQQRVSLARAIVRKPDVLLLDEPLANLDAKLRLEMRSEIRRIQQETGITAVLVTHDQVEAMSMCDRIAIMNGGKIVQVDTPTEMYSNPVNDFVAGFWATHPFHSFLVRFAVTVLSTAKVVSPCLYLKGTEIIKPLKLGYAQRMSPCVPKKTAMQKISRQCVSLKTKAVRTSMI